MPPRLKSLIQPLRNAVCPSCRRTLLTTSSLQAEKNRVEDMQPHFKLLRDLQSQHKPFKNTYTETADSTVALSNLNLRKLETGATRDANSHALHRAAERLRSASEYSNPDERMQEIELKKRIGRDWKFGDIYSPRDLASTEQRKWLKKRVIVRSSDAFDMIGKSPLAFYRNFTVLTEFISETGRIKHHKATGLRPKNQRKLAKAIRRAIGIGLIPSVHHHPLLIKSDLGIQSIV